MPKASTFVYANFIVKRHWEKVAMAAWIEELEKKSLCSGTSYTNSEKKAK